MDLTCITGSFGEQSWADLAHERAGPSVEAEGLPWVHVHGEVLDTYGASLADCRNRAAEQTDAEWLCFLDADDVLRPGFRDAMAEAAKSGADLLTPAVEYVRNGRVRPAMFWPQRPLTEGNWLIVSTLVRREMFWAVGGYRDVPMYEDYDLWIRCVLAGATIEKVPAAVCRVHINLGSVHRRGSTQQQKRDARDLVLSLNPGLCPSPS